MEINFKKLRKFLVKAKKETYASLKSKEVTPERAGHKELEFQEDEFYYIDSYIGFFQAPGMEEVRLGGKNGETIWTMAFSGGMLLKYQKNIEFAKSTFNFLKKALRLIDEKNPYRGPTKLEDGEWKYLNETIGDIKRFKGIERIFFKDEEVFNQDYIGGIVIKK